MSDPSQQIHLPIVTSFLEAQRELTRHIADLQTWCETWCDDACPSEPDVFNRLSKRLLELHARLLEHFVDEESGGYLKPALDVAPRYTSRAETLQKQHGDFLRRLDTINSRLLRQNQPDFRWADIQVELKTFLDDLHQHEHAENKIMQTAFGDDLGAGD